MSGKQLAITLSAIGALIAFAGVIAATLVALSSPGDGGSTRADTGQGTSRDEATPGGGRDEATPAGGEDRGSTEKPANGKLPKPGVYFATPDDVVGGEENTKLEFELVRKDGKLRLKYVAGGGARPTECNDGKPPEPSSTGSLFMTDEVEGGGVLKKPEFAVRFKDDFTKLSGRATGPDEIQGTFAFELEYQRVCTGSIEFTAHRQPDGSATLGEAVEAIGS